MLILMSIVLIIIAIIMFIVEFLFFKGIRKCVYKQQQGKIYVKVVSTDTVYGWILIRDLTALSNNTKSRDEHIRVESGMDYHLIQVKSIKEILKIKSVWRIVIGNL